MTEDEKEMFCDLWQHIGDALHKWVTPDEPTVNDESI